MTLTSLCSLKFIDGGQLKTTKKKENVIFYLGGGDQGDNTSSFKVELQVAINLNIWFSLGVGRHAKKTL